MTLRKSICLLSLIQGVELYDLQSLSWLWNSMILGTKIYQGVGFLWIFRQKNNIYFLALRNKYSWYTSSVATQGGGGGGGDNRSKKEAWVVLPPTGQKLNDLRVFLPPPPPSLTVKCYKDHGFIWGRGVQPYCVSLCHIGIRVVLGYTLNTLWHIITKHLMF